MDFLDPKGKDYQLQKIMQGKSERRQLELARSLIEKRANRVELKQKQKAATDDISPFTGNLFIRHGKSLTFCSLEMFHATFFHVVETIKVRGMARNLKDDVSLYFNNKVQTKRMYTYLNLS